MANKNDLRYIKTEKLIKETYLELRKKSCAPVKVNELCAEAYINKSTFYLHYETMEALHNTICLGEVGKVIDMLPDFETVFSDTEGYVRTAVKLVLDNQDTFNILFGDDMPLIINTMEKCLLNRYLKPDATAEEKMLLIFTIGGGTRLLYKNTDEVHIQMCISLIKKLFGING